MHVLTFSFVFLCVVCAVSIELFAVRHSQRCKSLAGAFEITRKAPTFAVAGSARLNAKRAQRT